MIEPIMYMAIGFLVSMLLGLMFLPLVHNRAERLTKKRIEAATPLSLAEIQADKDQLRAEFAMSARKLELNVDQLKNKATSQLAELGKKSDAISRMKLELGDKTATILSLEARERAVEDRLQATSAELEKTAGALTSTERSLAEHQADVERLKADLSKQSQTAESRLVELNAAHAQIDTLQIRIDTTEADLASTRRDLEEKRDEAAAVSRDLEEARRRIESLSHRVSDLDGQLVAQVREAERLGQHAETLEGRLAAQDRPSAAPDGENATTAHEDNTLLRERINDIAAEVAKLAMTLEGPDSPIPAILAAESSQSAMSGKAAGGPQQVTLAERIRALQAGAAQAARQPV